MEPTLGHPVAGFRASGQGVALLLFLCLCVLCFYVCLLNVRYVFEGVPSLFTFRPSSFAYVLLECALVLPRVLHKSVACSFYALFGLRPFLA
jgi:hypothetical protein